MFLFLFSSSSPPVVCFLNGLKLLSDGFPICLNYMYMYMYM